MAKRKECPVCGTPIKVENLEKHIKKVHPKEKVEIDFSEKEKAAIKRKRVKEKELARTSRNKVYAVVAIIVVIAVIAAVIINLPSQSPKVEVTSTNHDFGTVYNPTTLTHSFTISNIGDGTLEISRIETSCICTSATLNVGGAISGPYSHGTSKSPTVWKEQIQPGESGTLMVYYNSTYFGDTGLNVRNIYVDTNDPAMSTITFEVRTFINR